MSMKENVVTLIAKGAQGSIKYIQPAAPETQQRRIADVYHQAKRAALLSPPLMLHSPSPDVLAAVWMMWSETLVVRGVDRAKKERIAAEVSRGNECPYCVDVHTLVLQGAGSSEFAPDQPQQTANASQHSALSAWAQATRNPDAEILRRPPFTEREAPELIGTALFFHYLNRIVNVFLENNAIPLPGALNGLRALVNRVGAATVGRTIFASGTQPGSSLGLLPEHPAWSDAPWADANPHVQGAFARAAFAIEAAGERSVPERIRALVEARLQTWRGETMPMSRKWVENAIVDLPEDEQPAARLMLLTALASYQVDESVIRAFRRVQPQDEHLINATAWASFAAMRRINHWIRGS